MRPRCDAVSETLTVAAGDSLGHSYQNGVCVRCGALMPVTPFDDVPDDAYYTEAVYWAKRCGITNGVSSTCFAPNATCTRAQSVTFLWNAAGKPEPSSLTVPFTDVSADAYYYKALCWAVERKITNGTSGTTFSPNGHRDARTGGDDDVARRRQPGGRRGSDVHGRSGKCVLRGRSALGRRQ